MLTNKCITPLACDREEIKRIPQNKETKQSVMNGRGARENRAISCFDTTEPNDSAAAINCEQDSIKQHSLIYNLAVYKHHI